MIKPQKNSPRAYLHDLNIEDNNATVRSPVELYNTKLRKEGDPILTEAEYTVMMRKRFDARKKDRGVTQFIIIDKEEINLLEQMAGYQRLYDTTMNKIGEMIDKEVGISEDKQGEPQGRVPKEEFLTTFPIKEEDDRSQANTTD